MDNAIPWYKSHALWGCAAAIVIAAFNYFHVVLPDSITRDQLTGFFLQAAPIMVAIWGRITAQSVVVGTPSRAAEINAPAESELETLAGFLVQLKKQGSSPTLVAHIAGTLAAVAANELQIQQTPSRSDSPAPAGGGNEEATTGPTGPSDLPPATIAPSAAAHL